MSRITITPPTLAQICAGRRLLMLGAASLAAAGLLLGAAQAAGAYPEKPVRVVVPFPPGGSTDSAARIMTKGLADQLGQPFIAENRAGAAGTIGTASVTRADPDGYTLGVGPVGATIITPLIGMTVPYDPVKDIVPIGNIGSLPLVFAVNAGVPANTLQELVALAKSQPGKLSYGTSGAGTPGHLAFEYFIRLAKLDIVQVPYKGDAPLTTDLLGGQLELGILTGPAALAQAKTGKLKLLAVTSGQRYPQLPDVPTVIEAGYADFSIEIWNLLIAPAGVAPEKLAVLNQAMNTFLQQTDTQATLRAQGYLPPVPMSLDEMKRFVDTDRKRWETIVRTTGIRIN